MPEAAADTPIEPNLDFPGALAFSTKVFGPGFSNQALAEAGSLATQVAAAINILDTPKETDGKISDMGPLTEKVNALAASHAPEGQIEAQTDRIRLGVHLTLLAHALANPGIAHDDPEEMAQNLQAVVDDFFKAIKLLPTAEEIAQRFTLRYLGGKGFNKDRTMRQLVKEALTEAKSLKREHQIAAMAKAENGHRSPAYLAAQMVDQAPGLFDEKLSQVLSCELDDEGRPTETALDDLNPAAFEPMWKALHDIRVEHNHESPRKQAKALKAYLKTTWVGTNMLGNALAVNRQKAIVNHLMAEDFSERQSAVTAIIMDAFKDAAKFDAPQARTQLFPASKMAQAFTLGTARLLRRIPGFSLTQRADVQAIPVVGKAFGGDFFPSNVRSVKERQAKDAQDPPKWRPFAREVLGSGTSTLKAQMQAAGMEKFFEPAREAVVQHLADPIKDKGKALAQDPDFQAVLTEAQIEAASAAFAEKLGFPAPPGFVEEVVKALALPKITKDLVEARSDRITQLGKQLQFMALGHTQSSELQHAIDTLQAEFTPNTAGPSDTIRAYLANRNELNMGLAAIINGQEIIKATHTPQEELSQIQKDVRLYNSESTLGLETETMLAATYYRLDRAISRWEVKRIMVDSDEAIEKAKAELAPLQATAEQGLSSEKLAAKIQALDAKIQAHDDRKAAADIHNTALDQTIAEGKILLRELKVHRPFTPEPRTKFLWPGDGLQEPPKRRFPHRPAATAPVDDSTAAKTAAPAKAGGDLQRFYGA